MARHHIGDCIDFTDLVEVTRETVRLLGHVVPGFPDEADSVALSLSLYLALKFNEAPTHPIGVHRN